MNRDVTMIFLGASASATGSSIRGVCAMEPLGWVDLIGWLALNVVLFAYVLWKFEPLKEG